MMSARDMRQRMKLRILFPCISYYHDKRSATRNHGSPRPPLVYEKVYTIFHWVVGLISRCTYAHDPAGIDAILILVSGTRSMTRRPAWTGLHADLASLSERHLPYDLEKFISGTAYGECYGTMARTRYACRGPTKAMSTRSNNNGDPCCILRGLMRSHNTQKVWTRELHSFFGRQSAKYCISPSGHSAYSTLDGKKKKARLYTAYSLLEIRTATRRAVSTKPQEFAAGDLCTGGT
ncbi:hypothetical protein P171DRAFT_180449 [Karstenula rhodostoma CBS 690.94]|uniref:Uncharacterized protein n=1 Tax=Karstenula rhodostoma CBS 690.94 TaxID=1392251 RepID=A0A9P4P683_9PLEO|nr:hypothetical protein P171DRAFT_180449 [Karstenula rhodostoma CBS 690.94]